MASFDQIWAPWRLAYIKKGEGQHNEQEKAGPAPLSFLPGADPECFLCQAAADPCDRRRHVVHRSEQSLTLLNRFPYNNGHLLVAPRRHVAELEDLTEDELLELTVELTRMTGLVRRVLNPEGFNIGLNLGRVAGAGLPGHLHWHVVPRWSGDTNFMTVLASTNVIPQSLDALWEALTEALGKSQKPG